MQVENLQLVIPVKTQAIFGLRFFIGMKKLLASSALASFNLMPRKVMPGRHQNDLQHLI